MHTLRTALSLILALALLPQILSGCATVPDVKPFVESSGAMKLVVTEVIESSLARAEEFDRAKGDNELSNTTKLKTALAHHRAVFDAITAYSESVSALSAAPGKSNVATKKLTEALAKLVGSVTGPLGVLASSDSAKKALGKLPDIVEKIAANRARSTLARNFMDADEAISEIGEIYTNELDALSEMIKRVGDSLMGHVQEDFNHELRGEYIAKGTEELPGIQEIRNNLLQAILSNSNISKTGYSKETLEGNMTAYIKLGEMYDQIVAATANARERETTIRLATEAAQNKVRLAKIGIRTWVDAHKALGKALAKKENPSFGEIVEYLILLRKELGR